VEVNGYTIEPGANLGRAHLSMADLREANLDRVDLSGARTDGHTTWPDGFDPKAAEVIFED
jgi:uncharacterized protein YjbI with pentapeptide repeats